MTLRKRLDQLSRLGGGLTGTFACMSDTELLAWAPEQAATRRDQLRQEQRSGRRQQVRYPGETHVTGCRCTTCTGLAVIVGHPSDAELEADVQELRRKLAAGDKS